MDNVLKILSQEEISKLSREDLEIYANRFTDWILDTVTNYNNLKCENSSLKKEIESIKELKDALNKTMLYAKYENPNIICMTIFESKGKEEYELIKEWLENDRL